MIDYPKLPGQGNRELEDWLFRLTELVNRLEERIEVLERDQDQAR